MNIDLPDDFLKVVDWLAEHKKTNRDNILQLVIREYLNTESDRDSVVENMFWGLNRGLKESEWKDIVARIPVTYLKKRKSPNQLPKSYFFYCVITWDESTVVVITTKTEWRNSKCCNDGWILKECVRLDEICEVVDMRESMENHYSTNKPIDEVKRIMATFEDFKYHKGFEKFILGCIS